MVQLRQTHQHRLMVILHNIFVFTEITWLFIYKRTHTSSRTSSLALMGAGWLKPSSSSSSSNTRAEGEEEDEEEEDDEEEEEELSLRRGRRI